MRDFASSEFCSCGLEEAEKVEAYWPGTRTLMKIADGATDKTYVRIVQLCSAKHPFATLPPVVRKKIRESCTGPEEACGCLEASMQKHVGFDLLIKIGLGSVATSDPRFVEAKYQVAKECPLAFGTRDDRWPPSMVAKIAATCEAQKRLTHDQCTCISEHLSETVPYSVLLIGSTEGQGGPNQQRLVAAGLTSASECVRAIGP